MNLRNSPKLNISFIPYFSRLGVYSKSIGRQVVKAPKLYFCDNGLLNILSRHSGGVIFENSIFNQLKHYGSLSYWQEKSGNEIDFILDSKNSFESKESAGDRDFEKLKRLSIPLKLKNPRLVVKNRPKDFSDFIWGGDIFEKNEEFSQIIVYLVLLTTRKQKPWI